MRSPIIINDSAQIDVPGDLCIYDSVAAAERSYEPPDADDPSIHAFDIEGRLLRIVARDVNHVDIVPAESAPTHQETVERLVREFVRKWRPGIEEAGKSVEDVAWAIFESDPNPYSGTSKHSGHKE